MRGTIYDWQKTGLSKTDTITVCLQRRHYVLDGPLNKDTADQAKTFSVWFFCQRLVQR
jgi:hypothetical protein